MFLQDAKHGTTTGVSANDRATTVLALASKDSKPEDFNRPGHIFPLKYREGGVLKRAGHTEASVDLAVLAGFDPVAVICEVVDDDGSMARLPKLQQFALSHDLKIVSIADLIRYFGNKTSGESVTFLQFISFCDEISSSISYYANLCKITFSMDKGRNSYCAITAYRI